MARNISVLGAAILADAAGIATEMGGGTTTAEIQDIGRLLAVLGGRPDISIPLIKLALPTILDDILPG